MANIPRPQARFVDPREFGIEMPISSDKDLSRIARAINGIPEHKSSEQIKQEIKRLQRQLENKQ